MNKEKRKEWDKKREKNEIISGFLYILRLEKNFFKCEWGYGGFI